MRFAIIPVLVAAAGAALMGYAQLGAQEAPAERAARATTAASRAPTSDNRRDPQTRIIKALIEVLDSVEGEPQDDKDQIRKSLLESDARLQKLLGDNSRRLIMQANRRPPTPVVGRPAPKAPEAEKPAEKGPSAKRPEPGRRLQPAEPGGPQTRIVKALIEALDEVEGESAEDKDQVRQSLRQSDVQLREVLGDKSRQAIQRANRKPTIVVGGGPTPGKKGPAAKQPAQPQPPAAKEKPRVQADGEAQTRIVKALIDALDEVEADSDEARDEVRRTLLESDMQLRHVLGDNSRRMILKANRKPPIPVVGRSAPPPAKKAPAEKSKAPAKSP